MPLNSLHRQERQSAPIGRWVRGERRIEQKPSTRTSDRDLRSAPTQEAAAELLGLPFTTERGHLTRGLERGLDWLWQRAPRSRRVSHPQRS